jgi:hypothetical protein
MTEFTETALRHRCRNPRCRSKLPAPVSNPREAFCTRGCHSSFYRHRCLICEEPMERKTERQLVCGKRACRNALQASESLGRHHSSSGTVSPSKKHVNKGAKQATAIDRGVEWAIAVNRARIVAPRRVLDAAFGTVPLMQSEPELEVRKVAA